MDIETHVHVFGRKPMKSVGFGSRKVLIEDIDKKSIVDCTKPLIIIECGFWRIFVKIIQC